MPKSQQEAQLIVIYSKCSAPSSAQDSFEKVPRHFSSHPLPTANRICARGRPIFFFPRGAKRLPSSNRAPCSEIPPPKIYRAPRKTPPHFCGHKFTLDIKVHPIRGIVFSATAMFASYTLDRVALSKKGIPALTVAESRIG